MDSSFLVTIFHQLYDPAVPSCKAAQLNDGLRSFEVEEYCGKMCLQILKETHVDFVYISAISVLERHIKRKCLFSVNSEFINEIYSFLWPIAIASSNSVVGDKLANLIVLTSKYNLSTSPIHMTNKILQVLSSFKTVLIGSQMLLSVSQHFTNPKGVLRRRFRELEEGMRNQISQMFMTTFGILKFFYSLNTDQKEPPVFFSDFFETSREMVDDTFCHTVACNLLKFVGNVIPFSKTESLDVNFLTVLFNYVGIGDKLDFKFGFVRGNDLSGQSLGVLNLIIRDKLGLVRNDSFTVQIIGQCLCELQKPLSKLTGNYSRTFSGSHPFDHVYWVCLDRRLFDKFVEFFKTFIDKFVVKFDQCGQNGWIQVFYCLTFFRNKEEHLLECVNLWDKYLELIKDVQAAKNDSELKNIVCKLIFDLIDRLCTCNVVNNSVYEDCVEECDLLHAFLSLLSKAMVLYPRDVLTFLNDFSHSLYGELYSQNTFPKRLVDRMTISLKMTGSLVPTFASSFEEYFDVANSCLACLIKLITVLQSLSQDILLINAFETCQMFSTWVKEYHAVHGLDKSKDIINAVISVSVRTFSETLKSDPVLHSAAVLMRTFMQTVRPPLPKLSLMPVYLNLINSLYGSVVVPDRTKCELFVSYSNFLLLPWSVPTSGEQQWELRIAEYSLFIKNLSHNLDKSLFMSCGGRFTSVLGYEGSAKSREMCLTSFGDVVTSLLSRLDSNSLLEGNLCPEYFEFIACIMQSFGSGTGVDIVKNIFKIFCDCFSSLHDCPFVQYFKNNPDIFDSLLTCIAVAFQRTTTSFYPLVGDVLNILLNERFFSFSRGISPVSGLRIIFDIVESILTFHWNFFVSRLVPGVFTCESNQKLFVLIVQAYEVSFFETDLELGQKNLKLLKNFMKKNKILLYFKDLLFANIVENCLSLIRSEDFALIWEDAMTLLFDVADTDWQLFSQVISNYVAGINLPVLSYPMLEISWSCSKNEYSQFIENVSDLMSDIRLYDDLVR